MKYKFPSLIKDIFHDNPELKTVREYEALSAKEMAFVMLAGDVQSPHACKLQLENGEYLVRVSALEGAGLTDGNGRIGDKGKMILERKVDHVEQALALYRRDSGWQQLKILSAIDAMTETMIEFANESTDMLDTDGKVKLINSQRGIIKDGTFSKLVLERKTVLKLLAMDDQDMPIPAEDKKAPPTQEELLDPNK